MTWAGALKQFAQVSEEKNMKASNSEARRIRVGIIGGNPDRGWAAQAVAENRKTPLGLKVTVPLAPVLAYATRLLAENSQSVKR